MVSPRRWKRACASSGSSSRRHFVERERKTRRTIAAGERDMLAQHTDESFRADHVRFRNAGGRHPFPEQRRGSGGLRVMAPRIKSSGTPHCSAIESNTAPSGSCKSAAPALYRDPYTFVAIEYFFKAPSDLAERLVIVVAPVLATGNTATAAIDRVKERGAKDIRFVCLIAAQQGVERVRGFHPDVRLWTAAIDDRLDERGFIVPGLGDAGDRAYGTK